MGWGSSSAGWLWQINGLSMLDISAFPEAAADKRCWELVRLVSIEALVSKILSDVADLLLVWLIIYDR